MEIWLPDFKGAFFCSQGYALFEFIMDEENVNIYLLFSDPMAVPIINTKSYLHTVRTCSNLVSNLPVSDLLRSLNLSGTISLLFQEAR